MRIAFFYPDSIYAAWSVTHGVADELERMGHEVARLPILPSMSCSRSDFENIKARLPNHSQLSNDFDHILISGPEHLSAWIRAVYDKDWEKVRCPKYAWWHETMDRDDYKDRAHSIIMECADRHFFPGVQDAERFGGAWLPFGVDTEVFCPAPDGNQKYYDAAFIGLLYKKRQEFLKKIDVPILCGSVEVRGLAGYDPVATVSRYAEEIRNIRLFVNLPTLSNLVVTKVYEVMGCGTYLLTPTVPEMRNFKGLHCPTYNPEDPEGLKAAIEQLLKQPETRENLAKAFAAHIQKEHSLRARLEKMLEGA